MEEEYFPEGHEDCDYMVGMSINDIHLLYHSVQETIRVCLVLRHAQLKSKNNWCR